MAAPKVRILPLLCYFLGCQDNELDARVVPIAALALMASGPAACLSMLNLHADPPCRRRDEVSLDEVERIAI